MAMRDRGNNLVGRIIVRKILMLAPAMLALVAGGCGTREDYSTPKAAVKTFFVAMVRGESELAKASLCDAAQADLLDDVKSLVEGIAAAHDAAVAKFGEAGKTATGAPSLEDIDGAAEKVTGDTAVVECKNTQIKKMHLRKVGGQWKLDLCATFAVAPSKTKQVVQTIRKAVAEHVEHINSGQFKSVEEAESALQVTIQLSVLGQAFKGT